MTGPGNPYGPYSERPGGFDDSSTPTSGQEPYGHQQPGSSPWSAPYGEPAPYGGTPSYGGPPSYGGTPGVPGPPAAPAGPYDQPPSGYGPPGGYGAPGDHRAQVGGYGAYPALTGPDNTLGGWSLGLGIGAIVLSCVWIGWLVGIGAVVTGFMARKAVAQGRATNGGMALAGLILGFASIAIAIGLLALLIGGAFFSESMYAF
ncbi:DUF4190 domain-containing protein [Ruania suaedae]|uniref:DUF4190 domain-containing protein n=1 Tax=Ruania suaedae TaxID=2897774 RepID=UPI001E43D035|nr:DUF4190 domain-containing protein [Ruania suaedae]UFU04401.1 DUF4190 domain-containing protein [Ruania suaedae]